MEILISVPGREKSEADIRLCVVSCQWLVVKLTTGNGKMSVGAPKGLICSFGIICQAGDNV